MLDLTSLTPEQIATLKVQLGLTRPNGDTIVPTDGRSIIRQGRDRQLTDLRLLPKADDPRPLFVPSAEAPSSWNTTATFPYPRLLWSPQGQEITVHDAGTHQARLKAGYLETNPIQDVKDTDPQAALKAALDALEPAEREEILRKQKETRQAALVKQLADLPSTDIETLLADSLAQAKAAAKKTKTA